MPEPAGSCADRVLLLAPTGRDAPLMGEALSRTGICVHICADVRALAAEIDQGCGAVMIAEEALSSGAIGTLAGVLAKQPPWSDLPVIVLSRTGESTRPMEDVLNALAPLGNVAVIERPVRPATVISIVKTALRARHRQYEVQTLLTDLQVARERLRAMIESAYDYAIINLDPQGCVAYWNTGAERLLGYTEAEIMGRGTDLIFSDEDRRAGIPAQELKDALHSGRAETEGWRMRRDGSRFWASGVVSPIRDDSGAVTGFVKVLRDMTEHRRAEERLAEQARALQQSNEDLQRFAYAASHDLQEPLRTIASYSQLLARRNEGRLDADSREFIHYIVSGVERMRRLIQDLLEFSRLTSGQTQPRVAVDCNTILGLALQHLQFRISESRAKITFDRLPVVLGHESRLLQVFQNLISNALKYSENTPEIHVSAERDGSYWRIAIRDNGLGIAPEYHERIFRLFQRLHTRSEYPGTGIGLAMCKRIVEQEGGRIWVESAPGKGSTFYFTLPAA